MYFQITVTIIIFFSNKLFFVTIIFFKSGKPIPKMHCDILLLVYEFLFIHLLKKLKTKLRHELKHDFY